MDSLPKRTVRWCLDLIFPRYCLGCGQDGLYLCPDCLASLTILSGANCFICGRRSPSGYACDNCRSKNHSSLSGLLVAADWNDLLLRQIIYEYKYRFIRELADPLSELLINFLNTSRPIDWPIDELIIIPVPLHGRRLAWRGFNQAGIMARKISSKFSSALRDDILIRYRHTLPQRTIANRKERAANIKNAFTLSPKIRSEKKAPLENKVVVLVDDIATTASTLEDCAKTLEPLGPKEIWGLVIARG